MNKLSDNPVLAKLHAENERARIEEEKRLEAERLAKLEERRHSDEYYLIDTYYLQDIDLTNGYFKKEVRKEFPMVKFEDASDCIHGDRQMVYLPGKYEDLFKLFMFAHGWINSGLAFNMELMTTFNDSVMKEYCQKAYALYPELCEANLKMDIIKEKYLKD